MPVMQSTHGWKITKNSPNLWKKYFPWKKLSDHKYSRGRVVIYGGKKEFIGATILSSLAALKTGTGSVKIVCSKNTIHTYSIKFPSALKVEINNFNQMKKFLKEEKITSNPNLKILPQGSESKKMI